MNRRTGRYGVRILFVALVLILVAGMAGSWTVLAAEKVLTIVSTSDFHGNLLPGQKDKATGRDIGGAAILAAYVAEIRAQNPNGTLLLDDGDAMQGPAISTVFKGQSTIDLYNTLGYAAMAIGNHEFDWSLETLKQRIAQAKFPVLSANIFNKADGQRPDWARPYTIVTVNGLKVGIIGVSTVQTPVVTLPDNVKDLEFRDPSPVVNALIPELKGKGAELVVVIAHLGGAQDKSGNVTGEIADLARAVKGVDAIFGGHAHTTVAGTVNGVPVLIPYYNGRAVGVTKLTYDTAAAKVVKIDQEVVTTFADQVKPDAAAAAVVDRYNKDLAPVMAEVLGNAPAEILRNYDQESALGNMVADIMRQAAGTQMAFTNAGGLRADVPAGPVTLGKIWEVMPFDNTIVTMELTGAQVLEVLKNKSKGMVQSSGLRFKYDPAALGDTRAILEVTLLDGKPLDPNQVYTVATNNFMASGGDNFTAFTGGKKVFDTNILIRDAMVKWLKAETAAGRAIAPRIDGRAIPISK
ncbi:MAG: bifunctional metallophosphatase/5'-nucleotidase [Syntrophothermus sp.]